MISVLVTVYNRERYLAACLESILASTFQDFEVVIVDDGSVDDSVAIAERFAARDARIRFYRNEKNLGDYPNRMRAAELACGTYLKYVDSDDLIYPHSLAIMVEAMERYPDAALGLSHSMPEDDEPYPWCLEPAKAWRKHFLGRGCLSCGPSGAIIRREPFFKIGGFRDWDVLNDTDLWYRLSADWPVVLLPPGLVWWRRHEGQEFTRGNANLVYLEQGYELDRDSLCSSMAPLTEMDRQAALSRIDHRYARRLWSLALRQRQPRLAYQLFQRSKLGAMQLARGLRHYR